MLTYLLLNSMVNEWERYEFVKFSKNESWVQKNARTYSFSISILCMFAKFQQNWSIIKKIEKGSIPLKHYSTKLGTDKLFLPWALLHMPTTWRSAYMSACASAWNASFRCFSVSPSSWAAGANCGRALVMNKWYVTFWACSKQDHILT